jgi:type IV secretion system protein VirB4
MVDKIEKNILDDSGNTYNENIKNIPSADLLPFAAYIDEKTILTENGELLQIVKIPSFVDVRSEVEAYKLRDYLNDVFVANGKNKNINFWFQVVRKKVDLIPKNQLNKNYFAKIITDKWDKFYNWENQFANEIYISIVICPQESAATKIFDLIKGLSFGTIKKSRLKELQKMQIELNKCSNNFLNSLKEYEAKILKVVKGEDGIYYSEHLSFFNIIINNEYRNVKLPINRLSESLITKKIIYGLNEIIASNKQEQFHYSILSFKYCNNLLLSQLDKIIQLNQEMIVTQTVSFVDSKNFKDELEEKMTKLSINEDNVVLNMSGFYELYDGIVNKPPYSNCASQLTIRLSGKSKEELDANIKILLKITKQIGLVAVREEMFMPTLFWSQLPANFNFIKRAQLVPQEDVGGYTSLYNFPIGKITNNHWGDCIGILKSTLDTPYFLPLHSEKNGNFVIVGPKSFRKTKYLNLLLLMSLKQCDNIYYIDCTNRSNVFVNAIGGNYYFITKRDAKNRMTLNPFSLKKTEENIKFILSWVRNVIFIEDSKMIKLDENASDMEQEWNVLKEEITKNIDSIKKIGDVADICKDKNLELIKESLEKWCDQEEYGMIFNQEDDIFSAKSNDILGFNLSNIINNETLRSVVTDYLLYRIMRTSGNKNTILAIDESWILFDNKIVGEKLTDIFQKLYSKNIVLLTTTSGSTSYENSNIKFSTKNIFATRMLLPNVKATVYQKKVFFISEEEARIISIMREEKGNFLLKSGKNVLVSSFDFSFLNNEEKLILENNTISLNLMKKAKELINSELPQDWLPLFSLMMKEYDKKKHEQKMKEREKRQIKWEEAKQDSSSNNSILQS